jgi:hypothetical protein
MEERYLLLLGGGMRLFRHFRSSRAGFLKWPWNVPGERRQRVSPLAGSRILPGVKIETVRKHALSLDAVTEQPHHEYASFRVRGKIFVTVPPAGDVIHVFVDEEDRERALAMYPAWTEKLLWGGKVVGLRITLAPAVPAAVRALVGKARETRVRKG